MAKRGTPRHGIATLGDIREAIDRANAPALAGAAHALLSSLGAVWRKSCIRPHAVHRENHFAGLEQEVARVQTALEQFDRTLSKT